MPKMRYELVPAGETLDAEKLSEMQTILQQHSVRYELVDERFLDLKSLSSVSVTMLAQEAQQDKSIVVHTWSISVNRVPILSYSRESGLTPGPLPQKAGDGAAPNPKPKVAAAAPSGDAAADGGDDADLDLGAVEAGLQPRGQSGTPPATLDVPDGDGDGQHAQQQGGQGGGEHDHPKPPPRVAAAFGDLAADGDDDDEAAHAQQQQQPAAAAAAPGTSGGGDVADDEPDLPPKGFDVVFMLRVFAGAAVAAGVLLLLAGTSGSALLGLSAAASVNCVNAGLSIFSVGAAAGLATAAGPMPGLSLG